MMIVNKLTVTSWGCIETPGTCAFNIHSLFLSMYHIIQVSMDGHFGFGLVSEESIVKFLVINVNLSHLRTHSFSHLRLQILGIFLENNSVKI